MKLLKRLQPSCTRTAKQMTYDVYSVSFFPRFLSPVSEMIDFIICCSGPASSRDTIEIVEFQTPVDETQKQNTGNNFF